MNIIKRLLRNQEGAVGLIMVLAFMGLAAPLLTTSLGLAGALSRDSRVKTDILANQYSTLGVREYVRFLLLDPEAFDDFMDSGGEGSITVNGEEIDFTVTENPPIYTPGGDITLKEDATLEGSLISGDSDIEVKEDVVMQGDVRAGGNVTVKEDSLVQGNIISGGNVLIKEDARIEGNITAAGTVELKPGASVTGTIEEQATITSLVPEEYTGTPVLETGEDDVTVNGGQSLALDPGSYRDLLVKEDATLELRSGRYSFASIEIKEDANIKFELSGDPVEPVIIDAATNLVVKEDVVMEILPGPGSAADIWFRVQEEIELKEDGQFLGIYLTLRPGDVYGVTATVSGGDSLGSFTIIQ